MSAHRHIVMPVQRIERVKICLARCAINLSSDGPSIRVWHKYHPLDDGCIRSPLRPRNRPFQSSSGPRVMSPPIVMLPPPPSAIPMRYYAIFGIIEPLLSFGGFVGALLDPLEVRLSA